MKDFLKQYKVSSAQGTKHTLSSWRVSRLFVFSAALALLCFLSMPASSFAQAADVSILASPTSVFIGEQIRVDYAVATSSFRASDSIIMVDTTTRQVFATQSVGQLKTGTKIFKTFRPGTYEFRYRANLLRGAILGTSPVVTVEIPSGENYTLTASATSLESGEPLVVTYAAPPASHQYADSITIINSSTNAFVATQFLGLNSSGAKTFILRNPGSYIVQYKLALTGRPVVKTAGPITVAAPNGADYILTPSATTLQSGEPLVVTYAAPPATHQFGDSITIINSNTNAFVATQFVGRNSSGAKTFILRNPGSYTIQYKLALTGRPVIKTAGPVTVALPDAALFTLTPALATAEIDQPIAVSYTAPVFGHQFSDTIVVIETATGKTVGTQFVGASPSGTKIFRIQKTGTYTFAYRMSIAGRPIAKESEDVSVVLVDLSRIRNFPLREGPVIALGDSITFGRDATAGHDFVALLSGRLGEPIVNAGVVGDTTAEALLRLDRDVISKHPKLVIVFLGGNDFLQKVPTDTTFNNLALIVDRIEQDGGAVLLLAYKNFFLVNYDAKYRALAWEKGAAYTPDLMKGILGNSTYTTDRVHPRDNGHEIIADRIEPYLRILLQK